MAGEEDMPLEPESPGLTLEPRQMRPGARDDEPDIGPLPDDLRPDVQQEAEVLPGLERSHEEGDELTLEPEPLHQRLGLGPGLEPALHAVVRDAQLLGRDAEDLGRLTLRELAPDHHALDLPHHPPLDQRIQAPVVEVMVVRDDGNVEPVEAAGAERRRSDVAQGVGAENVESPGVVDPLDEPRQHQRRHRPPETAADRQAMHGPVPDALRHPLVPGDQDVEGHPAIGQGAQHLALVHLAAEPSLRVEAAMRRADAHRLSELLSASSRSAPDRRAPRGTAVPFASPSGAAR